MKSKITLIKEKMEKNKAIFKNCINLMEEAIKKNYPNGYNFNKTSHSDRFLYYADIDDEYTYCSGFENVYIKAIEQTKSFKKIANKIKKNGYKYEFTAHVSYPYSRAEWEIYLHITKDEDCNKVKKHVKLMDDILQKNYPNGLDFDEFPYVERIVWYSIEI